MPYLPGHASTSLHEFSRQTSLQAARLALTAHRDMVTLDLSHSADFMKIQGTVFHLFIGALILAIDLCLNRPQGTDHQQELSELEVVIAQLDGIKHHSQIATKYLEHLTQLLTKYKIWSSSTLDSSDTEDGAALLNADSFVNDQIGAFDIDKSLLFDSVWDAFAGYPSGLDMIDVSKM
jgi:hypothetical protein